MKTAQERAHGLPRAATRAAQPAPVVSFYLLVLQQDEPHYSDVDGVPDAGVVEQPRHLQHAKAKEMKPKRKTLPCDTTAGKYICRGR